jgi:hypothetical protein
VFPPATQPNTQETTVTNPPEANDSVEFMANVVREALTCDRPQCAPNDHAKFVSENFRIAQNEIKASK